MADISGLLRLRALVQRLEPWFSDGRYQWTAKALTLTERTLVQRWQQILMYHCCLTFPQCTCVACVCLYPMVCDCHQATGLQVCWLLCMVCRWHEVTLQGVLLVFLRALCIVSLTRGHSTIVWLVGFFFVFCSVFVVDTNACSHSDGGYVYGPPTKFVVYRLCILIMCN